MLIICLLKGVPARTTKVVTVGGVLKREEMDLVLNPHDKKAIEAADYVRRQVGGKVIAVTMGPDFKLIPIVSQLYDTEVFGLDEAYILSDPKMAGADTLATAYTVGLGVKKVLDIHLQAIEKLIDAVNNLQKEELESLAKEMYISNLLPNSIYSTLPSVRNSLVKQYMQGSISKEQLIDGLKREKDELMQFVVFAGIKTTDGETGSVGPQVAEALSELLDFELPHATYVDDFYVDPESLSLYAERKMGRLLQRLHLELPAVLTINSEYRARPADPLNQLLVRSRNFKGKVRQPKKFNASELGADPNRLGLSGSPTIVGPGIDIGKPPVQKFVGKSLVFLQKVEGISWDGKNYTFEKGDIADSLPEAILKDLREKGLVGTFTMEMMLEELFRQ